MSRVQRLEGIFDGDLVNFQSPLTSILQPETPGGAMMVCANVSRESWQPVFCEEISSQSVICM
jgi:hypothetical protein